MSRTNEPDELAARIASQDLMGNPGRAALWACRVVAPSLRHAAPQNEHEQSSVDGLLVALQKLEEAVRSGAPVDLTPVEASCVAGTVGSVLLMLEEFKLRPDARIRSMFPKPYPEKKDLLLARVACMMLAGGEA